MQDTYIKLHDEHRELEKQLNWYKAKLNNELTDAQAEAQQKYSNELKEYENKKKNYDDLYAAKVREVRAHNQVLTATCEARRKNYLKEASQLKIFIPEELRSVKKFVAEFKVSDIK